MELKTGLIKNRRFKKAAMTVICVFLCVICGFQAFAYDLDLTGGRSDSHIFTPLFDEKYKDYYFIANIDDETEKIIEENGISPEIDEMLDLYAELSLYGLDREQAVTTMLRQFLWNYPEMIPYLGDSLLTAFDPYGGYYSQVSARELFSNAYHGYGIVLGGKEMTGGNKYSAIIENCFYGSPAYYAGIEIGDEIIKIDNINIEGMGVNAVSNLLSVFKDKISLTVRRNGKDITFSMSKATVEVPSVSLLYIDDETGTAAIKVENFTDEYMLDYIFYLFDYMYENDYKNIIIDLRNNSGGDLYNTLNFLNLFVEEEGVVLYSEVDRDGNIESIKSGGPGIEFENICVITNGYSASASEIFALSLREIAGAVIIGQNTYGKGVGQYYITLENGDTAAITAVEILSPNGTGYHEIGVEPDIKISPEYTDAEKEPFGQLNFVNCANIKKGANNNAVLALNQRLARMGYISPDDVTSECTDKTITAVEIFQKYNDLPVGINKIDYIFLEYLSYYVSYYSPNRYQERDVQFECAEICIVQGGQAAIDYAEEFTD